jgi:hypothetical protein
MKKMVYKIFRILGNVSLAFTLAFIAFLLVFHNKLAKIPQFSNIWTLIIVLEILFVVGLIFSKSPKSR